METVAAPAPAQLLALLERHGADAQAHRSLALLHASAGGDRDEPEQLTLGERDRRLAALRRSLFGESIDGWMRCPHCDEEIALSVRVSDLFGGAPGGGAPEPLEVDGYRVRFRLPTCGDLAACVEAPARPEDDLLSSCIVAAERDGQPLAGDDLPKRVRHAVAERLAELDADSLVQLAAGCPACDAAFVVPFDITSYLWEELAAAAEALLDDVHMLAWAYGWTESEILALSPPRREAYIERVLQ
jgi:hypothetical protein